jgi:hypothetical protein
MTIEPPALLKRYILYAKIIYAATKATQEVVMRLGVIVVVGLMALDGYLLNEPMLFKEIERIIDRGPGQGGIHPSEGLVDLLCRGVLCIVLEKRQDSGALNRQENPPPLKPCLLLL